MEQTIINQPAGGSAGAAIVAGLNDPAWTTFRCTVAFAKQSGVKHIAPALHAFAGRGNADVRVTVGLSGRVTSLEGLQELWRLLAGRGQLFAFEEGLPNSIFHPKVYYFRNETQAQLITGSANLTEGGLYMNHEFCTSTMLDLSDPGDAQLAESAGGALDIWQTPSDSCRLVDAQLLTDLHAQGDLPSELILRIIRRRTESLLDSAKGLDSLSPIVFSMSRAVAAAPKPPPPPPGLPTPPVVPTPPPPALSGTAGPPAQPGVTPTPPAVSVSGHAALLMEVVPHPNGEVFLSYRAVREDPEFFGRPFTGWSTPRSATAAAYPMATPDPLVDIFIYDATGEVLKSKLIHNLNLVDYERKSEIRVTIPDGMVTHIPKMSLLKMTKNPTSSLDYRLEFFPPGSPGLEELSGSLTITLPSGGKPVSRRYGWL